MVKNIGGHYYLYRYRNVKGADGKVRHRNGAYLGIYVEGKGFVGKKKDSTKGTNNSSK